MTLNPVWHGMLYSCTRMTTVVVRVLTFVFTFPLLVYSATFGVYINSDIKFYRFWFTWRLDDNHCTFQCVGIF